MPENVDNQNGLWRKIKDLCSWYGARHTQCLMLFLLFILAHGTKAILSVGIVAMTNPSSDASSNIPTYSWNNNDVILSSFLWGYIITQVPSGHLSTIYGPKKLLAVAMFLNSIFCAVIPFVASIGSWCVIACRIGQGISQGCFFTSSHSALGRWVPLEERSRLAAFVYAGGSLGTVISLAVTGWISGSTLGWPYAFYLYGALCLCWSLAYSLLGSNSPSDHPTIDEAERFYIENSLQKSGHIKVRSTPWKKIITSKHVWAIIVTHCAQNWGFWILLTNIPTFINKILHFDIEENGLLSSGPYLLVFVLSFGLGKIADSLIKNKKASILTTRKIFNSISAFIPGVALLLLGVVASLNASLKEAMLVLLYVAVGAEAASYSGFLVNHLDISPVYAGTLIGVTNTFATVFSIAAPLAVQWIVEDKTNPHQWANAFYITSGLYVLSNIFFIIYASGDVQPWNTPNEKSGQETMEA